MKEFLRSFNVAEPQELKPALFSLMFSGSTLLKMKIISGACETGSHSHAYIVSYKEKQNKTDNKLLHY